MKRPYLTPSLAGLAVLLALAGGVLAALAAPEGQHTPWFIAVTALLGALFLLGFEILLRLARLRQAGERAERVAQQAVALHHHLAPASPPPALGGVALPVEAMVEYVRAVAHLRPGLVVELGGGTSTVYGGLALRANGGEGARLVALDEDEAWAEVTREWVREQGLEEICEVRHAPRKPFPGQEGPATTWYDTAALTDLDHVDLLLVDGPVDRADRGGREPALAAFAERLSERAVILADDGHRPRWRRAVLAFAAEHGFRAREIPYCESRTLLLERG